MPGGWLYYITWRKLVTLKLYSSFKRTLLTDCGTNMDQISVLFSGYTVEFRKSPEQKQRTKILASAEMKVDWNLLFPQDIKHFLAGNSNKQQLIEYLLRCS